MIGNGGDMSNGNGKERPGCGERFGRWSACVIIGVCGVITLVYVGYHRLSETAFALAVALGVALGLGGPAMLLVLLWARNLPTRNKTTMIDPGPPPPPGYGYVQRSPTGYPQQYLPPGGGWGTPWAPQTMPYGMAAVTPGPQGMARQQPTIKVVGNDGSVTVDDGSK